MSTRILARRGRATAALGLTALALSAGAALAATAGDLDPSFERRRQAHTAVQDQSRSRCCPRPAGKVVMTDEESSTVVRLNTDGSLDRSFGGDGVVTDIMDVSVWAPRRCSPTASSSWPVQSASTSATTVARLDTDGSHAFR